ncbi:MAG: protein kinase [Myxococcales bacterium]|nr:protein kinase [Myxococcales bacterium]
MFQPAQFGKYYLYERIAVGGMAEIYKAKMYGVDGFEKNMVVKQILPQYARNKDFITMFVDEAKITVSLQHGNIVPVYELGQIDGVYYLSMDLIDGKNLGELLDAGLDKNQRLSVPHALYIACEILAGLDYAHRKTDERGNPLGIVHRDVSPQNVLVSYEGEVKIVDFGIARAATKVHSTQAGVIKGKFGYMSPEQAMGKDVDARSDVFAAGILLYEMLTLERLFYSETDVVTLDRVKRADVPTPSRTNPNLPPQLDAIVFKALARRPEDRYQSAGEMRLAISRFLYGLPVEASANTLSAYLKGLFQAELEERRRQPAIRMPAAAPAAPPRAQLIASAPAIPAPPAAPAPAAPVPAAPRPAPRPAAPAGPEALFGEGPPGSPVGQAHAPPAESGLLLPSLEDEAVDDDFSFKRAARRARWIGIVVAVAALALGVIFLGGPVVRLLSGDGGGTSRLAKQSLGTLVVRSRPTGASVYFGNQKVGTTDVRIGDIDPKKEYELVLTLEGYPPYSRKIVPTDFKPEAEMTIQVFKDWTADALK